MGREFPSGCCLEPSNISLSMSHILEGICGRGDSPGLLEFLVYFILERGSILSRRQGNEANLIYRICAGAQFLYC